MSAFTAEKREGKAPGEVLGQEAPSTPVGKKTNSGSAEKMAVDGAGEGKPQATPSPAKAAGAKAQAGEAAGAGGKTGSGSKKRAATEASKAAKKAEVRGIKTRRRATHACSLTMVHALCLYSPWRCPLQHSKKTREGFGVAVKLALTKIVLITGQGQDSRDRNADSRHVSGERTLPHSRAFIFSLRLRCCSHVEAPQSIHRVEAAQKPRYSAVGACGAQGSSLPIRPFSTTAAFPSLTMRSATPQKPGGSSNKKAKTGEESTTSPAKENLPPPTRLEMPSGIAKDATEEPADGGADAVKDEIMIVDDDSQSKATASDKNEAKKHEPVPMEVEGAAGRQKLVAQVKPAAEQSNTLAPSASASASAAPAPAPAVPDAAAKAKKAAPKKAKQVAMPAEEKEKKLKLLNEELSLLSKMQVHGDNIPFLRAAEEEEAEELDGVETGDEVLPAKTKQVIARIVEGSAKPAGELAKSLQANNASAKQMDVEAGAADLACYERAIEAVAEYVEGFYVLEGTSPSEQGVPTFQKVRIHRPFQALQTHF